MVANAELAELVDALVSGTSVRKDFRVQVPGSALKKKCAKAIHAYRGSVFVLVVPLQDRSKGTPKT